MVVLLGLVVFLSCAGALAGWGARALLGRLRRGVVVRAGWCEAGVAALWAGTAATNPPTAWLPVLLGLGWLTVALTATDLIHRRLPDALTLPAVPVALVLLLPTGTAVHGLLGAAVLVAVHAVVHLLAPHALGAGDVKLAGPLGAVLGGVSWTALVAGPVLAALLTALAGVLGLACGRLHRDDPLPHGPAMLVAALVLVHLR